MNVLKNNKSLSEEETIQRFLEITKKHFGPQDENKSLMIWNEDSLPAIVTEYHQGYFNFVKLVNNPSVPRDHFSQFMLRNSSNIYTQIDALLPVPDGKRYAYDFTSLMYNEFSLRLVDIGSSELIISDEIRNMLDIIARCLPKRMANQLLHLPIIDVKLDSLYDTYKIPDEILIRLIPVSELRESEKRSIYEAYIRANNLSKQYDIDTLRFDHSSEPEFTIINRLAEQIEFDGCFPKVEY